MRNHSPFLLQTIKQYNMSKITKNKKTKTKEMTTINKLITFIPNQQKSSFTNYRNLIVMKINEMIEYQNKTIDNQSEKVSKISNERFKSRDELNQFIKDNGFETFGKSIIKGYIKKQYEFQEKKRP